MGTCWYPAPSRTSRMAATRPSIMSDGATMSAPAAAWLRAVRARTVEGDIQALNQEPHYRLAFAAVEWVEELLSEVPDAPVPAEG